MGKTIVIALGGNALGENLAEQMVAVKSTSRSIVDLIAQGHRVVVTHGNGPQVGMIDTAFEAAAMTEAHTPHLPMSVCVALSQGYIGYDLQNALREELLDRGMQMPVASLITQIIVDEHDPAFKDPSKPIGSHFSQEQAEVMVRNGYVMKEDAGRGWRRVVASPKPLDVVEKETVRAMLQAGQLAIAVGGGGIPVFRQGHHLKGASAVVDKDLASGKLAEMIDADLLIILTAVERVALDFGKPQQRWLERMSVDEARRYMNEGHFAKGSMLPKVQAAVDFAASRPGRSTLITLLAKAKDGIEGRTGTRIG
ncbi:MAG TPA: carbamate kinase [Rubrivivax sp.]|nr:carbamate kinase [Rubrivivax sp.]